MGRDRFVILLFAAFFALSTQAGERWTILVYLAADHELTPMAIADLREMEAKLPVRNASKDAPEIRILAELDTNLPTGRKRYEITQDSRPIERLSAGEVSALQETSLLSPVLQTLSETTRESQAAKLLSFLRWGKAHAPATRTILILWGHGRGFGQGLLPDRSDGGLLSVIDLRKALEASRGNGGAPLDLLLFDTCSMMNLETITELAKEARFVSGTPLLLPEPGLPYGRLLTEIRKGAFKATPDPIYSLAASLPKLALGSFLPGLGSQWKLDPLAFKDFLYVSVSVPELSRVAIPTLADWAGILHSTIRNSPPFAAALREALSSAPDYARDGNRDLGIVLAAVPAAIYAVSPDGRFADPLLKANARAREALFRAVAGSGKGKEISWDRSSRRWIANPAGLTVWLPFSEDSVAERPVMDRSISWKTFPAWRSLAQDFFKYLKP